jgi:hypothetical protein
MTTTSLAKDLPTVTAAMASSSRSDARTVVDLLFVTGQFDDAAFGRKVAAQDGDAAARFQCLVERANHFLSGRFARIGSFLGEGAAGNGDGGAIDACPPTGGARLRGCPPAVSTSAARKRPPE